jgi:hypothetical protein
VKKVLIPVLVFLAVICLGVTACPGIGYIVGTGPVANQTFDLTDFKNIQVSNAFGYEITHSDNFSVTVSAHENIFSHLDIKQTGDTLIIRMKPGSYTNSETRAIITLPDLTGLNVSGASRGSAKGFKSTSQLDINLSGSSQLDLAVEAGKTRIKISGASKMTSVLTAGNTDLEISGASNLTGSLTSQDIRVNLSGASRCEINGSAAGGNIEISGASRFTATSFKMENATINASGASTAHIYCDGTLNIEASGASTVKYSGSPQIKGLDVTGASHVSSE